MNKNVLSSMVAVCCLLFACGESGHEEDREILSATDSFVTAYFNYDFKKASSFVTPESKLWLKYAASNVLDEDIELLKLQKKGASHEPVDINRRSDSTVTVLCRVENFLQRDTLGRPGHIVKEKTCTMNLVLRNGKWVVDAGSLDFVHR